MTKKLRISHLIIQPVLVWDENEELSPGPELQPFSAGLKKSQELIDNLPFEVKELQSQLESQEEE